MRFPPRLVLAASVLGVFAAGSGTVLMMPEHAEEPAVAMPELAAATEPRAPAPAPVEPARSTGPAITGAQIAAIALAPARDRAAALVEQARAEAEAERARAADRDDGESGSASDSRDQWRKLRDEIREACDDGRIRGSICRGG